MSQIQIPIAMDGNLYINGLLPVYVDDTTFTLTSGWCRDSSNVTDIILENDITVYTTTQGVINGLDTGTIEPDKWYYVYAISDSSETNPTGALLSLDNMSPQLVYGYDTSRFVGYVYIDSSSKIAAFYYVGYQNYRTIYLEEELTTAIAASGSVSYASFSFGAKLPIYPYYNTIMTALLNASFVANSAGNGAFFATLGFGGSGNGQIYLKSPVASQTMATSIEVPVKFGTNAMWIDWKTSSASDALTLTVSGIKFTV